MAFFSTIITPTTAVQMLLQEKPYIKKVTQLIASVRSMGTSTYSAVGGIDSQDKRLTFVRDYISISVSGIQKWIDPSTLFITSDTADAVIEILGETYEEEAFPK